MGRMATGRLGRLVGLVLAMVLAGQAAAGQDRDEQSPVSWAGPLKYKIDGDATIHTPPPPLTMERIVPMRQRVAELRIRARAGQLTERETAELDRCWAMASSSPPRPGQDTLLAEVLLARSEQLESLGRLQEALDVTTRPLMAWSHPLVAAQPDSFVPAPSDVLALGDRVAQGELVQARQDALRQQLGASLGSSEDAGLDRGVRQAIAIGDFALVVEIGTRAVPVLEQVVLENLGDFPSDVGRDPLFYLVMLAERHAALTILEHIDGGGYAWHQRIVRAMEDQNVLNPDEAWGGRESEAGPRVCRVPEWPAILARLLRSPDSAREAMFLVRQVVQADGVTPEMTTSLAAAVDSGIPDLVNDVMSILGGIRGARDSTKPLLEQLLGHADPTVRRRASNRLLQFERNEALLSRASDPDESVRRDVARSLYDRRSDGGNRVIHPVVSDAGIAALRRLISDPSSDVRSTAAEAAVNLAPRVEGEVFRRLMVDPDPRVRARLARLSHPDEALTAEVMTTLAGDSDEESVLASLDNRLSREETWSRPTPFLEAARLRLLNSVAPPDSSDHERMRHNLGAFDAGFRTLMRASLDDPTQTLSRKIWSNSRGMLQTSTGSSEAALFILEDELLADAYVQVHATNANSFRYLNQAMERQNPPRWGAMLLVLENQEAPVAVRLLAASFAAPGGGERFGAGLVSLFTAAEWGLRGLSQDEVNLLLRLLDDLPEGELNPLLLSLAREQGVRPSIVETALRAYEPEGPLGRELTLEVLRRWSTSGRTSYEPLDTALFHLRTLPDDVDPELLKRAARTAEYADYAVRAMGALRDPNYLPVLEECLHADWIRNSGTACASSRTRSRPSRGT